MILTDTMIATSFDESNLALSRSNGMTEEPLCVMKTKTEDGFPVVVSCWKMTKEEKEEFLRTGRIWLTVYGETMPPVSVDGIKPWE
jgi:hypothetical protein